MRMRKALSGAALLAVGAIALSGCASGGSTTDSAKFPVAGNVTVEGSPTFDAIKQRGKVIVGVKDDQPGLGYLDAATNERSGFDIEVAQWMAASLGFGDDKIEYKSIPSANREQSIINGDIDYYVGTYSITDKRKQQIGFAGPYFVTGQGLLVRSDDDSIKGPDDLAGKTVCSATGSTPIQNIRENYPEVKVTEFDKYSQCVDGLKNKQLDAVTTDEAILIGYAAQDPDSLKVVGEPFTTEKYGIGLSKDDTALRTFFNKTLTDGGSTWTEIFDRTLGASGTKVEQPKVEAY
ncbi:MAG: transporter substrate-binding domain-containing protein [Pseudoclavibacter sp.]